VSVGWGGRRYTGRVNEKWSKGSRAHVSRRSINSKTRMVDTKLACPHARMRLCMHLSPLYSSESINIYSCRLTEKAAAEAAAARKSAVRIMFDALGVIRSG